MSLAHWASHHRRSILFLLAIAALGGIFSALNLPVALFPHIEFPRVAISLDAGDRPATQMMTQVTRPVEQAVKTVPGIREIRSTTSRGSAELSLNFDWGMNMDIATLQIQSAVTRVLPTLPSGTTFDVRRMNPTALYPVTAYALTSDTIDPVKLRDIARNELVPLLSAVTGVATVDIMGGQKREFRVNVNPELLTSYGMTLKDVTDALSASNVLEVTGRVEDRHKLLLIYADTRKQTTDEILHTIIHSGPDGVIELKDVATVYKGSEPQTSIVEEDGHPAVILQIFQQPDGNTVQIVKDVKQTIASYKDKLPSGLKLSNWYDQSQLIMESAKSVGDAILIGILLAALVLFSFLRNTRITLAVIIVVPAVLASTVLLLHVLNMSFNIMTLGGMAAAIGLIIDDAIVIIEQIVRHMKVDDPDRHQTIRVAVREFLSPLAGSSASTVVIFVPLAFLSGVTGAFFKALSLTMACALVISFFVAWFAVPLLADHLLKDRGYSDKEHGPYFMKVLNLYRRVTVGFLRKPLLLALPLGLLLGVGYLAYANVGSGFMPAMDEGGFIIDYVTPPGTSLTDTNQLLLRIGAILKATPEVLTYSRRTGQQLGGGLTEPNTGDFFVRLKPPPRRNIEDIMADLRQKISKQVPGIDIEMAQLMEDMIGDLTAVPQPIEIKIFGDDPALLQKTARHIAGALGNIKGVVDIFDGVVVAGDALDIHIDQTKTALEGLDPATVTAQLNAYLTGVIATTVQTDIKSIGVRAWIPARYRATPDQMKKLLIDAPDGHKVPLGRIASISLLTGQPEIQRDNLKTMVAVTARIEGRDLGSTIQDVKTMLAKPGMVPQGTYTTLGGLYAQQQIAFRGLMAVLVSAFALVFLLLVFLYEQFAIALSIIVMPLLAMSAVFIGLWIAGIELNITALMGMTMIVGIVTEVAIFYFSEYQLHATGKQSFHESLVEAGVSRFRPIAMTTLAAILALLPLVLGIGQGSDMQKPLAVAIISGLIIQMPLVLVVMPVLYSRLSRRPAVKPSPDE
jgi:CzcA family heavy metal efflux pump